MVGNMCSKLSSVTRTKDNYVEIVWFMRGGRSDTRSGSYQIFQYKDIEHVQVFLHFESGSGVLCQGSDILGRGFESSHKMEQKISSLPIDLTSEILFRLPAKSVGRFYCLSKLWLSITADPRFIKSLGTTRPSLLLCSIKGHHIFVSHQSSMIRSYASSQPFHLYLMCCTGREKE
ncbi:hypothetical protein YC2023_061564 [Brassica napus]